jgi:hypothetical protein
LLRSLTNGLLHSAEPEIGVSCMLDWATFCFCFFAIDWNEMIIFLFSDSWWMLFPFPVSCLVLMDYLSKTLGKGTNAHIAQASIALIDLMIKRCVWVSECVVSFRDSLLVFDLRSHFRLFLVSRIFWKRLTTQNTLQSMSLFTLSLFSR